MIIRKYYAVCGSINLFTVQIFPASTRIWVSYKRDCLLSSPILLGWAVSEVFFKSSFSDTDRFAQKLYGIKEQTTTFIFILFNTHWLITIMIWWTIFSYEKLYKRLNFPNIFLNLKFNFYFTTGVQKMRVTFGPVFVALLSYSVPFVLGTSAAIGE
jgi:hypothetical protein